MIGSFPDSNKGKVCTRQKENSVQTHRHEIAWSMWIHTGSKILLQYQSCKTVEGVYKLPNHEMPRITW